MKRYDRVITALRGSIPDRPPISFDVRFDCDSIEEVYRHFEATDKNGLYTSAGIDGFSVWEWNAIMGEYIDEAKTIPDGTKLDF